MKLSTKHLSILFGVLTVLLLCIGSAAVAYNYSYMQFAIIYEGASAPASIAFLVAIPFLPAIAVTAFLTFIFNKRSKSD